MRTPVSALLLVLMLVLNPVAVPADHGGFQPLCGDLYENGGDECPLHAGTLGVYMVGGTTVNGTAQITSIRVQLSVRATGAVLLECFVNRVAPGIPTSGSATCGGGTHRTDLAPGANLICRATATGAQRAGYQCVAL